MPYVRSPAYSGPMWLSGFPHTHLPVLFRVRAIPELGIRAVWPHRDRARNRSPDCTFLGCPDADELVHLRVLPLRRKIVGVTDTRPCIAVTNTNSYITGRKPTLLSIHRHSPFQCNPSRSFQIASSLPRPPAKGRALLTSPT